MPENMTEAVEQTYCHRQTYNNLTYLCLSGVIFRCLTLSREHSCFLLYDNVLQISSLESVKMSKVISYARGQVQ